MVRWYSYGCRGNKKKKRMRIAETGGDALHRCLRFVGRVAMARKRNWAKKKKKKKRERMRAFFHQTRTAPNFPRCCRRVLMVMVVVDESNANVVASPSRTKRDLTSRRAESCSRRSTSRHKAQPRPIHVCTLCKYVLEQTREKCSTRSRTLSEIRTDTRNTITLETILIQSLPIGIDLTGLDRTCLYSLVTIDVA